MLKELPLPSDEVLFLRGSAGVVGFAKFGKKGSIFMGTPDLEEISIFMGPDDLIAVSAFNTGLQIEKGIKSMIYLLRDVGAPLVVLPDKHPTSLRLPLVVSCGELIRLDCKIQPGTHPEQDILCACDELSGLEIRATSHGIQIHGNLPQ
ncbi:MAG TPA: hypothetical protein VK444_05420, partial [Methanobacteriaceae archaeon]|nr:hypothetical protein [Methanobacteriaceae archaeon]